MGSPYETVYGVIKVQMKCFCFFIADFELKEQQKSGRSPFTVS